MTESSATISVDHLAFDSEQLGRPVWRVTVPESPVTAADLAAAVDRARAEGAWLVSARITTESPAASVLEAAGFRPIERLVTLRWEPGAGDDLPGADPRVRAGAPDDADACAAIAARAFTFDRYHADDRVPDEGADRLKAAWVANDVRGRADRVLVAVDDDGRTVGFNLLLRSGNLAVIDLIAVDPDAARRGFGRALVVAAQRASVDRDGIEVGTQHTNAASLALYRGAGFRDVRVQRTFHLVLP